MQTIKIPGQGDVVASNVVFVAESKAAKILAASEDTDLIPDLSYEIVTVKSTIKVSEGTLPREEFMKALRGDYVPAADRESTGGVQLASSRPGPGGVRQ